VAIQQKDSDLMKIPLPLDIFYEIALHLSHTRDALALALNNRSIRSALLTSALFKSLIVARMGREWMAR
jgi:hypothetical protein